MDILRQTRGAIRAGFTRTANVLDELLRSTSPSADTLVGLLAQLEEKGRKLETQDSEITALLQEERPPPEEYAKEIETSEQYSDRLTSLLARGNRLLRILESGGHSGTPSIHNEPTFSRRKYRLPELELKRFSGDLKDWLGFWGQFKKIHEDVDIGSEDKFQYLIQATVANSRARQLVDSFPPTAESYQRAVDGLKNRFGRDDMLVEVYVRELLRLVLNNALSTKQKSSLTTLYDKLETQLRALESLGVTTDKYAAMLYPLVESCLPEDVLRTWERCRCSSVAPRENGELSTNRLNQLMVFLRTEVDGEERISLARTGFGVVPENKRTKPKYSPQEEVDFPTAAGLLSGKQAPMKPRIQTCIFCDKQHTSQECSQATSLTLEAKRKIVAEKSCCFACLKPGHLARRCKSRHSCPVCEKRHFALMCPNLPAHQRESAQHSGKPENPPPTDGVLANHAFSSEVLLQTLLVRIRGKNQDRFVRALLDTGSQRSYISVLAATTMQLECLGKEKIVHSLFGGVASKPQEHCRYTVHLEGINNNYVCSFDVLDQPKICSTIPKVPRGLWIDQLKERGIELTDVAPFDNRPSTPSDIHILIGADVAGKLLTGRVHPLPSGPVAVQTRLGWTLMGNVPLPCRSFSDSATLLTTLFVREASVADLWKLDALGIVDPGESKTKRDLEEEALLFFRQNVKRGHDGRYEVSLPWIAGHPPLTSNRRLAERRLDSTIRKLRADNRMTDYHAVLHEWLAEEIIEEVPASEKDILCHYLPHRAVIKESSQTTKIRPVFDASACEKRGPSLNDCLEKGPNLIEKIPSILNRFRKGRIGVVSDIRKAFLQINVAEKDRNFLRFLWRENGKEEGLRMYRHRRVVFGVSCSPFLLGATLSYHLEDAPEQLKETASQLKDSLYVDNCVASVDSELHLRTFIREANELLKSAQFELRGWCYNFPPYVEERNFSTVGEVQDVTVGLEIGEVQQSNVVQVLGLSWDLNQDRLYCDCQLPQSMERVTKRGILSVAHRIFDPIGFLCPVTLCPKLLLQETWELRLGWDEELPVQIAKRFTGWLQEIPMLSNVRIPRCLKVNGSSRASLHVFCDASKKAYATCIFLRVETDDGVSVQLVQARARVAPLKAKTIPRLELLSCCIGSRLAASVIKDLQIEDITTFYWSDSANALCWIRNEDQWTVFVWNRVQEIRTLSSPDRWHHVPGDQNPADLPSRGCSVKQLIATRWWEGPSWLYEPAENWPKSDALPDEDSENRERRKRIISAHCAPLDAGWYCKRLSSFIKIVRMIAWIFRFSYNTRKSVDQRVTGDLSFKEIEAAESVLWRMVQSESFDAGDDTRLRSLQPVRDNTGVLRVRTSIIRRKDAEAFRYPVVLPSKHPVVELLIHWKHLQLCHAGILVLMSELREKYWILRCRKTVRETILRCGRCRRFSARKVQVPPAPLPQDRVCDASVFQITGVDLAGPLFLKRGQKAWIVLFTCAVYRAVHLDLVTSLSTECFLQAFRRFIARRGRPSIVYSDNGTNFVGTAKALKQFNWEQIKAQASNRSIEWKFNPPYGAWWGGWWERLIRMLKELLRRVLGRACLHYEELVTVLCECESVMNARPLTYVSEEADELEPLTPSMFLQDVRTIVVQDIDQVDNNYLSKRARYCQKIREQLRQRFRSEYLGQLRPAKSDKTKPAPLSSGDVVLIENDNSKRIDWRLAKVIQTYPGKDGHVRVVRLRTRGGEVTRPVQRLYPLEIGDSTTKSAFPSLTKSKPVVTSDLPPPQQDTTNQSQGTDTKPEITTRSGRRVKPIDRLIYS